MFCDIVDTMRIKYNFINLILFAAKTDFSSMSTYNILRKDYKTVPKKDDNESSPSIGISSVIMDGTVLISREDFKDSLADYIQKKELDLLLVMFIQFETTQGNHEPKRHILIASSSSTPNNASIGNLSQLCNYLMVHHQNELMLKEKEIGSINSCLVNIARFYGHNPRWSRKTLMPALSKFNIK